MGREGGGFQHCGMQIEGTLRLNLKSTDSPLWGGEVGGGWRERERERGGGGERLLRQPEEFHSFLTDPHTWQPRDV